MTLKQEILQLITRSPGLTDREITNSLRGGATPQQPVNIACRELDTQGLLARIRNRSSDNFIGNYPGNADSSYFESKRDNKSKVATNADSDNLSEDEIKKILKAWLSRQGWNVEIAWGKQHGIDIEAFRAKEHWVIEVKGPGSRQPMRVNYFLAILGELLQRMSDKGSAYSIALPDMPQYHGLWDRLPSLAKRRTKISILFVGLDGTVTHLGQ
jgi:hypothetical protein